MTKKKNLLLQVLFLLGICGVVIVMLMLTGCDNDHNGGDSSPLESVEFNGDDDFVTSTVSSMTNQEAFDLMIESPNAIFILLDLVDDVLLRGNYEINEEMTVGVLDDFKAEEPNFEEWLIQSHFSSEADVLRFLEVEELRRAAVYHLIDITEEELEEAFQMWFDPEMDDFDQVRDDIYTELVREASRSISQEEVARLRSEAGLEIFNETLEAAYVEYLTMSGFDIEINEASSQSSAEVIARIDGIEITIGQFFATLSSQLGFEMVFEQFDQTLIAANATVDPAAVNEIIDDYRIEFGDEFDAIISEAGFETEEALYEFFEAYLLEEALIREHLAPSEERLREIHAELGTTVSGSHILVDDYDVAANLIEQLQDADNFSELFAELAAEYSSCGSAASGGDLGSWERGRMVEEFDNAIFELEVGEFTDTPVETQFGYHIIYKTGVDDVPAFEDAREDLIDQEIARLHQSGALNEVMVRLRQEAEIVFTNPTLQARFEFFVNAE